MPHSTTARVALLIVIAFFSVYLKSVPAGAQLPSPRQVVETHRIADRVELVRTSDMIVVAHIGTYSEKWPTMKRISARQRLVNARQRLSVRRVLKGSSSPPLYLLTTGVDPLPKPGDPLNSLYTGPLADGDFLLFLKAFSEKPYYTLNGGFSAVYPLIDGKTIALEEGFTEFGGKTEAEIAALISR